MRESFIFRFTVTFFFSITLFWLVSYFNVLNFNNDDVILLSLITSTFYIIFALDKKIKKTDELVKGNFWQLKNELKKKINGKEKKSGKQLL